MYFLNRKNYVFRVIINEFGTLFVITLFFYHDKDKNIGFFNTNN